MEAQAGKDDTMTEPVAADQHVTGSGHGLCGTHVIVDGEELTVEDTVLHAVVARKISDEFLDHGSDTYWCVDRQGRHRIVRASELAPAS